MYTGLRCKELKLNNSVFVIRCDWRSAYASYMLFASKLGKETLLDLGSRDRNYAISSYLVELDALMWVCKRTKPFRDEIPLLVLTDGHALLEKWLSRSLYGSDVRIFRRWGWWLANEHEISFEFVPGSENTGTDLLSRPAGKGLMDVPSPISRKVNEFPYEMRFGRNISKCIGVLKRLM